MYLVLFMAAQYTISTVLLGQVFFHLFRRYFFAEFSDSNPKIGLRSGFVPGIYHANSAGVSFGYMTNRSESTMGWANSLHKTSSKMCCISLIEVADMRHNSKLITGGTLILFFENIGLLSQELFCHLVVRRLRQFAWSKCCNGQLISNYKIFILLSRWTNKWR